ncbi:MAG TPA: ATP-dependent helicase, partial [Chloroflexota bacterium]|nr:ATP-dependent helicase [Chloroflexota bacterium]
MRGEQAVFTSGIAMDTAGKAASLGIPPAHGPTVIVGPAGSGKTTALVERVTALIAAGTPRDGVLLLAVSRQGADDLARRLSARLGAAAPAVATFHSFAFNLAQRHYQRAGYGRPPRLLAASQFWDETRRALAREEAARWPRYGGCLGSRSLLALINDLLSGAANNDLSPEESCRLLVEHGRPDLVELAEFSGRYRSYLKDRCLLSAELAVREAMHLLEGNADLLSSYRARYPHLLVDQFEDATYALARLARLLGDNGLFVAGNPLQAVNSYRGGSPAHLQRLIESPEARILSLSSSYRPAVAALRADSRLFPATVQSPEDPSPAPADGATPRTFRYQSEESAWITHQVASLLRSGIPPRDIAVLFRTGSDPLARDLALRLARAGIPVHSTLASNSAGADPMVVVAVDVLRYLSASPEDRPAAFLKLLPSPLGGLTRAELRALRRAAQDNRTSALSLAQDLAAMGDLPEDVAAAASELATRLVSLGALAQSSPDDLLWHLWVTFPAFARQATGDGAAHGGHSLASPAAYRAFLDEVARIVEDHQSASPNDIIRLYDDGHFHELDIASPRGNGSEVTIATVHQSRNAEWRYLFLPNLVEGAYPLRQSPIGNLAPMLLRAGQGEPEDLAERHLAEERRIFYVALSRAVDRVYLSSSGIAFDGTTRLVPSRYLSLLGLEESPDTGDSPPARTPEELVANYGRQLRSADSTVQAQALHALARLAQLHPRQADPSSWWDNL